MNRVSRRDFLKGSAAAAAPLFVPSRVLGRQDQPAPSARTTIAVIGVGKMGSFHLDRVSLDRSAKSRDFEVLGVCDVDATRRGIALKKARERGHTGCEGYADYREVLARKDLQTVLIATPDHWHAIIAIEALKAGKDIYCEKPLTLTIREAKVLIDAVRKYDRIFQVGSQQRSDTDGPFRNTCNYIRNGRLGRLKEIHVNIGPTSRPCDLPEEVPDPGLDWDFWLGPAPLRPYNEILCRRGSPDKYPFNPGWRDYREYSGGYVTDWGAHHFDIVQWALEMDRSGPVEIVPPEKEDAMFGTKVIYRGSPAGDEITAIHQNTTKETPNGIRFIGGKGEIFVDRKQAVSTPKEILEEKLGRDARIITRSPNHLQNWLQAVKSRRLPVCDVEVGARSVTVCHLVNLALWNRRRLKWDPRKWAFEGDKEADAWLDRERRAPYILPEI